MCEKTQAETLKEELFYSPEHASYLCDDGETEAADAFCEKYKDFLNTCKTERETTAFVKALAEKEALLQQRQILWFAVGIQYDRHV